MRRKALSGKASRRMKARGKKKHKRNRQGLVMRGGYRI